MVINPHRATVDTAEADANGSKAYRENLSIRFRRATAGWSLADQLHHAVKRRKTAEVNVLFNAGAVPAEKTLALAVNMKWSGAVEAFIIRTNPTPEMLAMARDDITAGILRRRLAVLESKPARRLILRRSITTQ